jgi:outer membrane protein assembly factor BamB
MSHRALLVVALLVCAVAADWPQFRGPDGLGVSPATGLPVRWGPGENVAWKAELPGPGTSSPVFVGDRIFITAFSGYNVPGRQGGDQADLKRHLVCLDRKTGSVIWTKDEPAKLPEQTRIRDGHGYASSTPAADAERVYVFSGKSGVAAYDHAGKRLWHADAGDRLHEWGSAASPVLHGKLVIVNASVESDSLYAFDRATGKQVWKVGGIKESWNTPVFVTVGRKTELVVAIQGKILGFDPQNGKPLWNCATDIGWYMVPSPAVHNGVLYYLGGRSGVAGLAVRAGGRGDVTRTHRLWTSKKGSNVSSPVYHNGHLYWMNDNTGTAFCAEAASGKVLYEERLPRCGQVYASALLADGRVHYLDRSGKAFVVAATPQFKLIGSNDLSDRSTFNASPVAIDGRLYLRSDKALYCIGTGK